MTKDKFTQSKSIILVIDDDSANLMKAQKILSADYRPALVNSGKSAFKYLEKNRPDMILLDINMPEMDGFEIIRRLKSNSECSSIPIIFLTADRDAESETRCFAEGAVDFVGKPFIPEVLLSRVKKNLELEKYRNRLETMVKEQAEIITLRTRKINEIQNQVIIGMANLIESRDGSTGEHVKRTQMFVDMIAGELKRCGLFSDILDEEYLQNLHKAAPLHDVGKIKIPDNILQKPAKLTAEEFETIKQHTTFSGDMIQQIIGDIGEEEYVKVVSEMAMYHHERWDGMGYPIGLKENEIPLCAQIMSVADVFDALYAERCYKKPVRPMSRVLEIIKEGRGTQFSPLVTDAFLALVPILTQLLQEREEES